MPPSVDGAIRAARAPRTRVVFSLRGAGARARSTATREQQDFWRARWPRTCFGRRGFDAEGDSILKGAQCMPSRLLTHVRYPVLLGLTLAAACGTQRAAAVRPAGAVDQP